MVAYIALLGFLLALFGTPVLLGLVRAVKADVLGMGPRLSLWLLASVVLAIAAIACADWRQSLGLRAISIITVPRGLGAALIMLSASPAVGWLQRALGGVPTDATEPFRRIAALPLYYRLFLAVTAAVTEEVLYRGYAIGCGAQILGGMTVAALLSLSIFTLGHYRWGWSHLPPVLWAGCTITLLFVAYHDLVACILAHFLVDAAGLIVAPFAVARRARIDRLQHKGA